MRTQTFKKSTIKSAFRNTGLITSKSPRSSKIYTDNHPASTRPYQRNDFSLHHHPHRPHEIKNQAYTLITSMRGDQRLVHPKFQPYLDRFIRGSVPNSLRCSIAERDLEITHREAIARAACKKLTGRVSQKGGVITVRDVRAKVIKRVETEVEKARRALEKAEAAELKKENARIAAHKKVWKKLLKELKAYLKA